MIEKAEHNPINAALIPFKARLLRMEAAKKWGVDMTGLVANERRLLMIFGAMAMGNMRYPEYWKYGDIRQVYHPLADQWECFFETWLKSAVGPEYVALHDLGIDIIGFENPYEILLLQLFGLLYGPEVEEEIKGFLWENNSMIYYHPDGTIKDLRDPRDFGTYFKENYDTPTFTETYGKGYRGFDN